jgi:Met-zincin/Domain of unknown function (DUF5117)/Domain of unknown function (DUF5118)
MRYHNAHVGRMTICALAIAAITGITGSAAAQAPALTIPSGAPATATAPTAAGRPDSAALRPFADVIKEAKLTSGFFNLYQKDEKVWLEVQPNQLNQPFFFQINSTKGLGEGFVHPHWMLRSHMVEFRRVGNSMQLVAKNSRYTAKPGTAIALAVADSFADSLLGATSVVSAPHLERKSVLIDANALFLNDIAGTATQLEAVFRLPYAFDARNSSFVSTRNSDDMTALSISAHFAMPKLPAPSLVPPPVPLPPPPSTLEDNRSMLLGYYYSLSKLPEKPMASRLADSRIGHFTQQKWIYTDDITPFPRTYVIKRWRLDKKDPAAAMSEPVQPITFWLDKNIPHKYRKTVEEGVLAWNKAFEKIGFKNALAVKQQQDTDTFDNNDTRHASVRWYVDVNDGALAIGPSRSDPRTGEILDADILFTDGWTRLPRRRAVEQLTSVAVEKTMRPSLSQVMANQALLRGEVPAQCSYADTAMDEVAFALDLLAARGDIDPDGPEAEKIVLDTLRDVVVHEVGHTLGLTHNFRASTIHTLEQMEDASFTRKSGLAGSVMEYNALNIAPKGRKQGEYVMSGIGAYDEWAIEYAYKPIDAAKEKDELLKIAARSKEPQLAFANDLDAGIGSVEGMDPEVNRRDLGADPLAFAERRMQLSRELWERLQDRKLKPGEQFDVLRRNFISANAQVALAANVAAKYVGGVVHLRDHADSGRAALNPVAAPTQRRALKLISDSLFRAESFRFKPEFVARLVPDQFDRLYGGGSLAAAVNPDVSISGAVLGLQRTTLDHLLSDAVAARIIDAPTKMKDAKQVFALSELYDTLQGAIWSELRAGGDISPLRRNLQREHLKRIVDALVRTRATTPADARALQRDNARQLAALIRAAATKPMSKEAKAHLNESLDTLNEALKAQIQRAS